MARHGGNLRELAALAGLEPSCILDFSASINPLGPPAWLPEAISKALPLTRHYPDPDCLALRQAIANMLGTAADTVLPANGSNELLYAIPRALTPRRVLVCPPCYADYAWAAAAAGCPVVRVPMRRDGRSFAVDYRELAAALTPGDLLYLGHPNNPTGDTLDVDAALELARSHPGAYVVVDEAFLDFVGEAKSVRHDAPANLIVLRSLTKFYAIPGLRLGYLLAAPRIDSMNRKWCARRSSPSPRTSSMA